MFFKELISPFQPPQDTYYDKNPAALDAYGALENFCEKTGQSPEDISIDEMFSLIEKTHFESMKFDPLIGVRTKYEYCNVLTDMNWWFFNKNAVYEIVFISAIVLSCFIALFYIFRRRQSISRTSRGVAVSGLALGIKAKKKVATYATDLANEARRKADEE